MAQNKTVPTDASVVSFLDGVESEVRRKDAWALHALMQEVTGTEPLMWGDSLVGFGRYQYRYESGREGEFFRVGFSPRKAQLVVYVMPGFDGYDELLARLGPHKTGRSCLYITRLERVDRAVLRELIEQSWRHMAQRYPTEGA